MRARTNQNLAIKAFVETNEKEAIVTFEPNKSSIKTCAQKGIPTTPITLRVVRVELGGEVAVREGRSTPRRLKNTKNGSHFSAHKRAL